MLITGNLAADVGAGSVLATLVHGDQEGECNPATTDTTSTPWFR